ncbi:MAG: foldase protein PrsA [Armatimonadota bacterium]
MQGKKTGVLAIAGVLIIAGSTLAQTKVPDVVGTVNGEKITKDQLVSTLLDWRASSTLDEMLQYKMIDQEAKKAGVVVKPEEVNAKIQEVKSSLPPGSSFTDMLKQRGLTPAHLSAILRMQLQVEKMVGKNIKVAAADYAEFRKASHILIVFGNAATEEDKAKADLTAKEKIDKIAAEIKSKSITFEDAAKKYSEDPGTKELGGDLNWITKGQTVPEFEKVVFTLKPGEISEPVKTSYGYHIIMLVQTGDSASAADKKMLADGILKTKQGEAIPAWFEAAKKRTKIQNLLEPAKPAAQVKPAAKPAVIKPGSKADDLDMPPPPPPVR